MAGQVRTRLLNEVADFIHDLPRPSPLRVAVDGRTASGKTTLADELATALRKRGATVIRSSIDGFHRPKAERYARGRHSAEGYYHDARDHSAIMTFLLNPLGPNGNRVYRTATFDLERDRSIEQKPEEAPADAILVVDGTFLQRPELGGGWDLKVFVQTSETIAERRGIDRDSQENGDTTAISELYATRYRPAFVIYEELCDPVSQADIVWTNNDFSAPELTIRD